jgi:hypothetical protein
VAEQKCPHEALMKDAQTLPKDSIDVSSNPDKRADISPDRKGWTSDDDDKKPTLTLTMPKTEDGEAPFVGRVELPTRKNVKSVVVEFKKPKSDKWTPATPNKRNPKKFRVGEPADEVRIVVEKKRPSKPVRLTVKLHACVHPVTTTAAPTTTTAAPTTTTEVQHKCAHPALMVDPLSLPESSVKPSSNPTGRTTRKPGQTVVCCSSRRFIHAVLHVTVPLVAFFLYACRMNITSRRFHRAPITKLYRRQLIV